MNGKSKCKILKEIRKRIAEENNIEYITEECTHKGNCKGTCPKCESEVRYLEKQLARRKAIGKTFAVACVAASVSLTTAGCELPDLPDLTTEATEAYVEGLVPNTEIESLEGDVIAPDPNETDEYILEGEATIESEPETGTSK